MAEPVIDPELPAAPYVRADPRISYVEPEHHWSRRALIGALERLSGRGALERIYQELKAEPFDVGNFFARALELGAIETEFTAGNEADIPADGPLVFVGNHPYGLVDGVIMCQLAARTRGEFRILLHARLCQDPDLAPYFLPVDFEETKTALKTNIATKRAALETLRRDGTIIIFPGGGVATAPGGFGEARELPWSTFAAKLVHQSRATVVPVFFHGQNSRLFHLASAVSETLRTALLLFEARNKLGKRFSVSIGRPVPYEEMEALRSRPELTHFLHERIALLGGIDPDAGFHPGF
jgi:putative hemolysin